MLKALGFNRFKSKRFQAIGFKYHPAPLTPRAAMPSVVFEDEHGELEAAQSSPTVGAEEVQARP